MKCCSFMKESAPVASPAAAELSHKRAFTPRSTPANPPTTSDAAASPRRLPRPTNNFLSVERWPGERCALRSRSCRQTCACGCGPALASGVDEPDGQNSHGGRR